MAYLEVLLLGFLIICALAATFVRSPMITVITLMAYSVIMSVIWLTLEAPDLAITEAAVGAGVDTVLFFVVLKKIRELHRTKKEEEDT
jgi:uncharacterized MnhB-related membrane protein